jgi:hypothetical protein
VTALDGFSVTESTPGVFQFRFTPEFAFSMGPFGEPLASQLRATAAALETAKKLMPTTQGLPLDALNLIPIHVLAEALNARCDFSVMVLCQVEPGIQESRKTFRFSKGDRIVITGLAMTEALRHAGAEFTASTFFDPSDPRAGGR